MILLELLIALALISILLTFLFSFFVESAKIEKKLDIARMHVAKRGYLQTRLQTILTTVDQTAQEPYFYTKQLKNGQKELILLFDNGIDPEPQFSGTILGKVYLSQDKHLSLATWPLTKEKNPPWRSEVLFENVKDFEFEFLGPNSASDGKKELMRPINPNFAWRTEWPKSLHAVPSVIRLSVIEEGLKEPLKYAFILPAHDPFIQIQEKTAL